MKPLLSRTNMQSIRISLALVCVVSFLLQFSLIRNLILEDSPTQTALDKVIKKPPQGQRVLILSGPLESGLSKLNSDISKWSSSYKLGPWSWSIPDIEKYNYTKDQGFDPLMDSMTYGLSHKLEMGPRFQDPQREIADYFLNEYRASFIAEWMKDKNILVGLPLSITTNDQGGDKIIESLVEILPWNSPKFVLPGSIGDITAVICYRPSRLKHLVSLWRSIVDHEKISFSKWLLSTNSINDIDALGIAEEFLKRGVSVIIVDVEDVSKNRLDLSHYISCNILDAPCDKNIIIGLEDFKSKVPLLDLSYDVSKTDLDDATLNEIERTLWQYDCKFEYYRTHGEVELLNGSLDKAFSFCASRQNDKELGNITSREGLRRKIVQIVHSRK